MDTPKSEINVDQMLEDFEERNRSPHRSEHSSPKRYQFSTKVQKDIKNALKIGQNGRINFKNRRVNHNAGDYIGGVEVS